MDKELNVMTAEEFKSDFLSDSPTLTVKTSGSTGAPKQMLVEKHRMLSSARMTCDFLNLTSEDTALLCMNLDYIGAKMVVVRAIERGMSLIEIAPCGHPFAHIESKIDFAAIVPLQLYNTLLVPEETEKLKSVRQVIIGGGAVDDEVEQRLRDFPNAIWSTYGMTETLSHVAMRRLSGDNASLWYSPLNGVAISQDAEGCLVIDAPALNPSRLITNDIVELNQYGQFRVLGRRDNVICSGGVKLQIEELERQLRPNLSKPFVITKRKEPKFGEIVVLVTEDANTDNVKKVCEQILDKYSCPKIYLRIKSVLRTQTGKIARADMEEYAKREILKVTKE